jgi:metal-responsive CopG/Arc/MetJ family transcriptional regulator
MDVAVSIPDEVFVEAERLIDRLDVSRDELYATALRQYLALHESDDDITAALNEVYQDEENRPDPAILAAGIETLRRVEW